MFYTGKTGTYFRQESHAGKEKKRYFFLQRPMLNMSRSDKLLIYDVTTWLTNNCNTHITQYLKK